MTLNQRILIADDHALIREAFKTLLNRVPGLEVIGTATNGQEAIDRTAELTPDVVLMDVAMPVVDGIAATQAIRAKNPDAVVIGLTAHEASTMEKQFINAGARAVFSKDSNMNLLIEYVQALGRAKDVERSATVG